MHLDRPLVANWVMVQISEMATAAVLRVHRWLNFLQGRDDHPGCLDVQVVSGEHIAHGIVLSVCLLAAFVKVVMETHLEKSKT